MVLLPIPLGNVEELTPHWLPFVERIAQRSGNSVEQLVRRVLSGEVQPVLLWDEQNKAAVALGGVRFVKEAERTVAEVLWLTGRDRKRWIHLIEDFERYARDAGCTKTRFIGRLGWTPLLKERGYRPTHVTMEKEL